MVYHPGVETETMTSEQFKQIRERSGLTQADFANAIGYHEKSMTRFESGRRKISKKLRATVLALFGRGVKQEQVGPVVGQTAKKTRK